MPKPDQSPEGKMNAQTRNIARAKYVALGGEAADFNDKVAENGGLGQMTHAQLVNAINELLLGQI